MDRFLQEFAEWERFKARRHLEKLLSNWRWEIGAPTVWVELDIPIMSLDNPLRGFNGIHSRN